MSQVKIGACNVRHSYPRGPVAHVFAQMPQTVAALDKAAGSGGAARRAAAISPA